MGVFTTMAVCAVGTTATVGAIKMASDLIKTRKDRKNKGWTWAKKLKAIAWGTLSLPVTMVDAVWRTFKADMGWNKGGRWAYRLISAAVVSIVAWFMPVCLAVWTLVYGCGGIWNWVEGWESDYHNYYCDVVSEFQKAELAKDRTSTTPEATPEGESA